MKSSEWNLNLFGKHNKQAVFCRGKNTDIEHKILVITQQKWERLKAR